MRRLALRKPASIYSHSVWAPPQQRGTGPAVLRCDLQCFPLAMLHPHPTAAAAAYVTCNPHFPQPQLPAAPMAAFTSVALGLSTICCPLGFNNATGRSRPPALYRSSVSVSIAAFMMRFAQQPGAAATVRGVLLSICGATQHWDLLRVLSRETSGSFLSARK